LIKNCFFFLVTTSSKNTTIHFLPKTFHLHFVTKVSEHLWNQCKNMKVYISIGLFNKKKFDQFLLTFFLSGGVKSHYRKF
jgi:hypothetical protein